MKRLWVIFLVVALAGCARKASTQQGEKRGGAPPPGHQGQGGPGKGHHPGGPGPIAVGQPNKPVYIDPSKRPEPSAKERPKGSYGPAWETNPGMPRSQYAGRDKQIEPGKDKGLDDEETCKKSFDCKLNGHCSVYEGWCVVLTDADCAGATVCKEEGRCKAIGDRPWKVGCQPENDAACKKAKDCPAYGRCTLQGNRCLATTDDECKKATVCKVEGKCKAKDGECTSS